MPCSLSVCINLSRAPSRGMALGAARIRKVKTQTAITLVVQRDTVTVTQKRVTYMIFYKLDILSHLFVRERGDDEHRSPPHTSSQRVKSLILPLYDKPKAVKSYISITSFPDNWNVSVPPSVSGYPMVNTTPSLRFPVTFAICTLTNKSCR